MLPAKLYGKDRQCSIGVDSGLWGGNTGLSSASCRTLSVLVGFSQKQTPVQGSECKVFTWEVIQGSTSRRVEK